MVLLRFDSPMHTSYNEQKTHHQPHVFQVFLKAEDSGRQDVYESLPARERLLGILAGTGRWYSNIMEGEQSNMKM